MAKRKHELHMRRRSVLKGMGGVVGAATLGGATACGSDDTTGAAATSGGGDPGSGGFGPGSGGAPGTGGAPSGGNGGAGGVGGDGGGGGSVQPGDCNGVSALSPEELLAPIDTIVVLMMENRSFDHYLGGSLGIVEMRPDVAGLVGTETNPLPNMGGNVGVYAMSDLTPDSPPHQWDAVHNQWNNGQNDGFVIENAGASMPEQAMGYFVRAQVPIHHALADAYAICNAMFCATLAGTWPNRFHLHGATSNGQKSNVPVFGFDPIWGPLKNVGVSVKNYHHGVAWATGGYGKLDDLANYASFKSAAGAGTLPNFSIIDPQFFGGGANDDHPSNANVPLAQLLISDVYTTLANSPQWNNCLLVVTYDEHGGFFDHVPPPLSGDANAEFANYGFRVPALVAGPYVKQGCAIDTVFDHVSVLRTLMTRWGVGALNPRMAMANDLSSCIEPAYVSAADPQPPVLLPMLDVSIGALRAHFDAVKRGRVSAQHPEIIASLRAQGIYQSVMRGVDHHATLKQHLEDAVQKGIARIVS